MFSSCNGWRFCIDPEREIILGLAWTYFPVILLFIILLYRENRHTQITVESITLT